MLPLLNKRFKLFALIFIINFQWINSMEIADLFGKCEIEDEKCIVQQLDSYFVNFANGIPELDVPGIEPLKIKRIVLLEASQSNAGISLEMILTDVELHKFSKSNGGYFKGFAKGMLKKPIAHLTLTVAAPQILMRGRANINGKFLLLPLKGYTDIIFDCQNMWTKFDVYAKSVKRADGKTYAEMKDFRMDMHIDSFHATFENSSLFNGDQTLMNSFAQVINDNWRDILVEVTPKIEAAIRKVFLVNMQKIFNVIPLDDFFKDSKLLW